MLFFWLNILIFLAVSAKNILELFLLYIIGYGISTLEYTGC